MTAFARSVLEFLAECGGQARAEDVGSRFWPDKAGIACQGGGPTRAAVIAAWQLGRLARHSLLIERVVGAQPAAYRMTGKGYRSLRETALAHH